MYIKYKNVNGVINFKPLSLSFVPNFTNVCVERVCEYPSVAFAITNGYYTEDIRNLCECVEKVHLNEEFDISDYFDVIDGLVAIGDELFYTAEQISAFIYLLEEALKNNEHVFDISELTEDELKSYIPKVTKIITLPKLEPENLIKIKMPFEDFYKEYIEQGFEFSNGKKNQDPITG